MSRVVELCGLPGAGKSTLARQIVAAVSARGGRCAIVDGPISAVAARPARVARRARLAAAETARHPLRSAAAARWIAASGQPSTRDIAAVLAQWLAVQRTIATARWETGVHLVEEGVVQSLWTLGLRARGDGVGRLTEGLPESARSDLIVVVEAPVEVVCDRLSARSSRHSRTQQLTGSAQLDELRRGQVLLETLLERIDVPVVRLSNDEPDATPQLAAQVVALL
jgi:thymidylate kinase